MDEATTATLSRLSYDGRCYLVGSLNLAQWVFFIVVFALVILMSSLSSLFFKVIVLAVLDENKQGDFRPYVVPMQAKLEVPLRNFLRYCFLVVTVFSLRRLYHIHSMFMTLILFLKPNIEST